jgi:hypothetical protein
MESIVEQNISDQGSKAGRAVPVDEIELSGRDWESNVELEAFLAYPFDIKDTIEHRKQCTGAQNLMFLYDLKENYCHKDARLEVKSLPKSLKLEHRERSVQQMGPGKLEHFVCVAREVMKKLVKSFRRRMPAVCRGWCTERV